MAKVIPDFVYYPYKDGDSILLADCGLYVCCQCSRQFYTMVSKLAHFHKSFMVFGCMVSM